MAMSERRIEMVMIDGAANASKPVVNQIGMSMFWVTALVLALVLVVVYCISRIRSLRLLSNQLTDDLDNEKNCFASLMEEREFLIREIHHRVKNNLQIMMSLLNMQSSYLHNDEATTAIKHSSHRLYAISLVHQKLYQAESLSSIDVPAYLQELGQYLLYEFGGTDRIDLRINVHPLLLDVNAAIPLGLIVQEALSNAFRHGYPHGKKGSVRLDLYSEDELQYLLQISDDGAGFPKGVDMTTESSLGKSLMAGLSGQLHGKLAIYDDHGVTVTLVFPKDLDASFPDMINKKKPSI